MNVCQMHTKGCYRGTYAKCPLCGEDAIVTKFEKALRQGGAAIHYDERTGFMVESRTTPKIAAIAPTYEQAIRKLAEMFAEKNALAEEIKREKNGGALAHVYKCNCPSPCNAHAKNKPDTLCGSCRRANFPPHAGSRCYCLNCWNGGSR